MRGDVKRFGGEKPTSLRCCVETRTTHRRADRGARREGEALLNGEKGVSLRNGGRKLLVFLYCSIRLIVAAEVSGK